MFINNKCPNSIGEILQAQLLKLDNKGRITLPARLRKQLKAKEFVAIERGGHVHIIPKLEFKDLFGTLPHLSREGIRDEKDRFD